MMKSISAILCSLAGECDQLAEVLKSYKGSGKVKASNLEIEKPITASEMVDVMESILDLPTSKGKRKRKI